jgi:molecular chaperone HtpG
MDFLESRGDDAIRKELKGIRDSYHHYWDILAELLQNSRDSITRNKERGQPGPYFIKVLLNGETNSIEIMDNGTGIDRSYVKDVLGPGGGDKDSTGREVGEKGVGLTFALFSSGSFSLQSRTANSPEYSGVVRNAKSWLYAEPSSSLQRPEYNETEVERAVPLDETIDGIRYDCSSYCRIRLDGVTPKEGDINLFQLSAKQLEFLLQTKTACGVTTRLHDPEVEPEFFVFCDLSLLSQSHCLSSFPAGYPLPHQLLSTRNVCTLEQVANDFITRSTEEARRRYLGEKAVWARRSITRDGWTIKVYGIMFLNNTSFAQLSRDPLRILGESESFNETEALFKSSIAIATKGMPTGIDIPAPTSGQYPAYYKRCLFIAESDELPFDLGRKSFHYRYRDRLQDAVADLFSSLVQLAKFQGEGRDRPRAETATRAEREAEERLAWDEALRLPDLSLPAIRFLKQPGCQEAAVAAIFHELVGAGILGSYRTCSSSYGSRYDAKVLYERQADIEPLRLILEFKHSVESILADFSENTKHYMTIDLIVAWDANEQKLSSEGFSLEVAEAERAYTYEGATHVLSIPYEGIEPIPVILLRHLIDRRTAA